MVLREYFHRRELGELLEMIQDDGKYQGRTLEEATKDVKYLNWLRTHQTWNPKFVALLVLAERLGLIPKPELPVEKKDKPQKKDSRPTDDQMKSAEIQGASSNDIPATDDSNTVSGSQIAMENALTVLQQEIFALQ